MSFLKLIICFTILLVVPLPAQQEMTAEDAIRLGLENNFDIRIARNNLEIAENNIGNGTAGFLPVLDASGAYIRSSTEQETNSPFSFGDSDTDTRSAQIVLNWTLFDGFRMFISRSQLTALAKAGEFQTKAIIENTVVAILRSFFNLVQQELLLEVSRNTLEISKTRLEKEQVRQELGAASTTELLNAQVSYNDDRATQINQELNVEIAKKDLNIILGREPDVHLTVEKNISIAPLELNLEQLTDLTFRKNNEIRSGEQEIQAAQKAVGLSRSSFFPRLLFNASYGYNDVSTSRSTPANTNGGFTLPEEITTESYAGNIGLTLSFNLFNGFRDRILWQNARLAEKNTQLAQQKLQNSILGTLREKYSTLQKRLELIDLEQQNVKAAEQNLQILQERYAIGSATSLEFRDAQVNLARARSLLISAQYQARISRLEIEQLAGILELE